LIFTIRFSILSPAHAGTRLQRNVANHHLVVPYHELVAVKSKGLAKTPSLHDNLLLHGDNLLALKALLPTHAGKVKCIYIDPPYNTGNEGWAYNDKVNSPLMRDWLGKTIAMT
jgi:adenine-specific DNA-methyltransferase